LFHAQNQKKKNPNALAATGDEEGNRRQRRGRRTGRHRQHRCFFHHRRVAIITGAGGQGEAWAEFCSPETTDAFHLSCPIAF